MVAGVRSVSKESGVKSKERGRNEEQVQLRIPLPSVWPNSSGSGNKKIVRFADAVPL